MATLQCYPATWLQILEWLEQENKLPNWEQNLIYLADDQGLIFYGC